MQPESNQLPPLHFAVPVWGEVFIDVFLNVCLRAQLSPGNIPGLQRLSSCRYVIYTTRKYHAQIVAHQSYRDLTAIIPTSIHFIDEDGEDPTQSADQGKKYVVKTDCYREALTSAVEAGAAIVLLNADILLADGFCAGVDRLLGQGYRALEVVGPRALKAPLCKEVLWRYGEEKSGLAVPPRDLARLWLRNMHPLMDLHMAEGELGTPAHPSHLYWRVGQDAILAHCFHLYPIMVYPNQKVDFNDTIDAGLISKICPDGKGTYIVKDSDEFFCCELSDPSHYVGAQTMLGSVSSIVAFYNGYEEQPGYSHLDVEIKIAAKDVDPREWETVSRRANAFIQEIKSERAYQKTVVPPKERPKFRILLAVWGRHHTDLFLQYALPSLLAPGNIPFLAENADCEFLIMTTSLDIPLFAGDPSIQALKKYMAVHYLDIEDIELRHSYGVLLTFAFVRGLRYYEKDAMNTHFIFLNADFLFSDNSFRNLFEITRKGYNAIVAPSFRCDAESFAALADPDQISATGALVRSGREFARFAIDNMHETFRLRVVNESQNHTILINQFLWKVDADTYLGRFYLQFMLCIKPEVPMNVVHGFCDYTFVPELVPSGRIYQVTDTDEILLLELQRRDHEREYWRAGRASNALLVERLGEWSTEHHRAYAQKNIALHSSDLPARFVEVAGEAEKFMNDIHLPPPQHYREHPYWAGTLAALKLDPAKLEPFIARIESLNKQVEKIESDISAGIFVPRQKPVSQQKWSGVLPVAMPPAGSFRRRLVNFVIRQLDRHGIFMTARRNVATFIAVALDVPESAVRNSCLPLNHFYMMALDRVRFQLGELKRVQAAYHATQEDAKYMASLFEEQLAKMEKRHLDSLDAMTAKERTGDSAARKT